MSAPSRLAPPSFVRAPSPVAGDRHDPRPSGGDAGFAGILESAAAVPTATEPDAGTDPVAATDLAGAAVVVATATVETVTTSPAPVGASASPSAAVPGTPGAAPADPADGADPEPDLAPPAVRVPAPPASADGTALGAGSLGVPGGPAAAVPPASAPTASLASAVPAGATASGAVVPLPGTAVPPSVAAVPPAGAPAASPASAVAAAANAMGVAARPTVADALAGAPTAPVVVPPSAPDAPTVAPPAVPTGTVVSPGADGTPQEPGGAPAPVSSPAADETAANASATASHPLAGGASVPPAGSVRAELAGAAARAVPTVGVALELLTGRGATTARLTLRPDALGGVDVHLRQTTLGLDVRLTADGAEASRALAASADVLRRQLESQGVTVLRLDVAAAPAPGGEAAAGDRRGTAAGSGAGGHGAGDRRDGPPHGTPTVVDLPLFPDTPGTTLALPDGTLVDVLA